MVNFACKKLNETSTRKMLCDNLSKFINAKINPYVDQWERERCFPARTLFKELGQLGVFGVDKPQQYGGLGLDFTHSVAIAETMGETNCGGIPMAVAVQSDMATPALAKYGSDRLKREFLAPSITGERIACIGVSEIGAGSDVSRLKTSAKTIAGDLLITGSKMWITNGHVADWICLLVNTNDSTSTKEKGSTCYHNKSLVCVELDRPGIVRSKKIEKLGMHCSDTAELFFDCVKVPRENIIVIKPLKKCISDTVEYAKQRTLFGKTLWEHQNTQFKLAELAAEVELLRSALYNAAKKKSMGDDVSLETSMLKLKAGRLARKVTDECLQLWGGMGYTWENPICRMFRDLRLVSIGAGSDEVMLSIIAKWLEKGGIRNK